MKRAHPYRKDEDEETRRHGDRGTRGQGDALNLRHFFRRIFGLTRNRRGTRHPSLLTFHLADFNAPKRYSS